MAYLTLFAAWAIAVVSPGPDFLAVLRTAAARGRRDGLLVAVGVVTGIGCWATLALTGLSLLLARYSHLYVLLRAVGAVFLLGYGVHIIWAARKPSAAPASPDGPDAPAPSAALRPRAGSGRAFRLGLMTNLANPKAVIFFGALFATLLPPQLAPYTRVGVVVVMLLMALAWFGAVARVAASPAVMSGYRRAHRALDRAAGGLFTVVGVALLPR